MTTRITRDFIESYLSCKYKGYLTVAGLRGLDRRDREVLAEAGFPVSAEDMAH